MSMRRSSNRSHTSFSRLYAAEIGTKHDTTSLPHDIIVVPYNKNNNIILLSYTRRITYYTHIILLQCNLGVVFRNRPAL